MPLNFPYQSKYGLKLDGATQYAQKATPVNMDLNGSEMITATDDRTFETTKGNWVDGGNHSAVRSTTDKRTGNASLAITSTAAGDMVGNSNDLAVIGANVVSGWDFTSAWVPNSVTVNSSSQFTTTGAYGFIARYSVLTIGATYRLTIVGSVSAGGSVKCSNATNDLVWFTGATGSFSKVIYGKIISDGSFYIQGGASVGQVITITTLKLELVTIPYSPALVLNSKYTVEAWARGTGIVGAEKITYPNLSNVVQWSDLSPSWVAAVGSLTHTAGSAGWCNAVITNFGIDVDYEVIFNIASMTAGSVQVGLQGVVISSAITGVGSHTVRVRSTTSGSEIGFWCVAAFDGVIDNVSVKIITQPIITLALGSKSQSTTGVSCVAGTFTKCVFNFQATATEIGQPLKIYANQVDVTYVDDVSLTQAYDGMVVATCKLQSVIAATIFDAIDNSGTSFYTLAQGAGSSNLLRATIKDGTTTIDYSTGGAVISGNIFHSLVVTYQRDGNITKYIDGIAIGTLAMSTIGKIIVANGKLIIGAFNGVSNFVLGNVGETQVVRFTSLPSDIATTIQAISSRKKCLSSYNNGTIVAWYDWKRQGFDKSSSGNHLTLVANPPIVRI